MPTVRANDLDIYHERQGAGEPLVLIPYLAIDQACYAFQVADYTKHFTCISVDLRGAGQTSKPDGPYTTELFADDVAAFLQAIGVERAHVAGLSLGAATGMWLAAKHPEKVKTLSLHSAWPKTDPFLRTVVEGWRELAKGLGSVTEMVILGIFPLVLHPGAVRGQAGVHRLAGRVRARPSDGGRGGVPAPVRGGLGPRRLGATGQDHRAYPGDPGPARPGVLDAVHRRPDRGIADTELVVFEDCSHAPIYENVPDFNAQTLAFLQRHSG